jgi:hypothetical protein
VPFAQSVLPTSQQNVPTPQGEPSSAQPGTPVVLVTLSPAVVVVVVLVVVVSPQSGGVGLAAILHTAAANFFLYLHAFLQAFPALPSGQVPLQPWSSIANSFLQSLGHLATADAAKATQSIANPTAARVRFMAFAILPL